MDSNKKQQNYARPNVKACQSNDSIRKTSDIQANKAWQHSSRRREQSIAPRNDNQRHSKQYPTPKTRPNVDKRPRPRGGGNSSYGAAGANDDVSAAGAGLADEEGPGGPLVENEYYSVYTPGSKKQNLNHLLNFHYAPRGFEQSAGLPVFGRNGGNGGNCSSYRPNLTGKKQTRYNKEQFLQANFQFVIKSSAKPQLNGSPDTLIDWDLIEQVNIQTTEEPQCPICLYPPIAAKLTRCGHAYCWPCILHYLSLSDKTWRKCPICYDSIHIGDLKSTMIFQQCAINVGKHITFHLMRRKKGSMFIEKYTTAEESVEYFPQISSVDDAKRFSKFLIAKRADILEIIERERRDLLTDADPTCAEYVFIQQALELLKMRREKLGDSCVKEDSADDKNEFKMDEKVINESAAKNILQEVDPEVEEPPATHAYATDSCNAVNADAAAASKVKYYYFYQSEDGQNIYLHPLNVKIIQACYGTLENAPHVIKAGILQKEQHFMDKDHRRKFTCLAHLPLTCQFSVVEVDLQPPIVTDDILEHFKDDILARKKERQRRNREERQREKKINEINDRQMGKLITATVNLNLKSSDEFPTCGFEEPLPSVEPNEKVVSPIKQPVKSKVGNRQISYSSVAVAVGQDLWPTLATPKTNGNYYNELSAWSIKSNTSTTNNQRTQSERSSDCDSGNDAEMAGGIVQATTTNFGDVLAEAFSQKKHTAGGGGNTAAAATGAIKKNKKSKKMVPLFSTGMNYNGN